jgi:hypothetical protein
MGSSGLDLLAKHDPTASQPKKILVMADASRTVMIEARHALGLAVANVVRRHRLVPKSSMIHNLRALQDSRARKAPVISRRMWLLLNDLRNEGDTAFHKQECSALTPIDAMDYAARVQQAVHELNGF